MLTSLRRFIKECVAASPEKAGAALFILVMIGSLIGKPVMEADQNIHLLRACYDIYSVAVSDVLAGRDPYPDIATTTVIPRLWYLYGPLFPLLFYPFSPDVLGPKAGMFLWLMLNLGVFWAGLFALLRRLSLPAASGWAFIATLALIAADLQGNLRFQQLNALMAGIIMIGLSFYMDKKYLASAGLLALATHIKLFPVIFAMLLMLEFNAVFIGSFAAFLALSFALPLLIISPAPYVAMLAHWASVLSQPPGHTDHFIGLPALLASLNAGWPKTPLTLFTLLNAGMVAVAAFAVRADNGRFMRVLFTLGMAFFLLFNSRTEFQTLVLATPVWVIAFLTSLDGARAGRRHFMGTALWIGSFALLTLLYTDLFPRPVKDTATCWHARTWGLILLYIWAWWNAWREYRNAPQSDSAEPAGKANSTI